jgi:hopanoid biosynthesis associated protein HpnK
MSVTNIKRVIINADDFGLCRSVNEGVILAHTQGILTSATLMANTPGFEQAVELARDNPRLGVGLHLNFVRGRPVSPPEKISSLVGADGLFFRRAAAVVLGLFSGRIKKGDLEREGRAQVEKALASGVRLSHFDSEKNIHVLPPLAGLVVKLAEAYNVRKVRFIKEYGLSAAVSQAFKAWFLTLSSRLAAAKFRRAGLVIADRFYGICNSGRMTSGRLRKILAGFRSGSAEIMVHPGCPSQEMTDLETTVGTYYINRYRQAELQALLDPGPAETASRCGVRLISFHDL